MMAFTPDERPIPGARLSKWLALGGTSYFYLMVAAFAAGGRLAEPNASVDTACRNSGAAAAVQPLWHALLIVTAVLSPLNIFWQPALAAMRLSGRGSMVYKVRSNGFSWNHVTHAQQYALCGVGQAAFIAIAVTYSIALLSSDCGGTLVARAVLVLLSAASLSPFLLYKLRPCVATRSCCPGWAAAYEAWGSKFAVDCSEGQGGRYEAKVAPGG